MAGVIRLPRTTLPAEALSATVSASCTRQSAMRLSTISIAGRTPPIAVSASAVVTPGPARSRAITKAISATTRGWRSDSTGTSSPSSTNMSSISMPKSGSVTPSISCRGCEVRPSRQPLIARPASTRRRNVVCLDRVGVGEGEVRPGLCDGLDRRAIDLCPPQSVGKLDDGGAVLVAHRRPVGRRAITPTRSSATGSAVPTAFTAAPPLPRRVKREYLSGPVIPVSIRRIGRRTAVFLLNGTSSTRGCRAPVGSGPTVNRSRSDVCSNPFTRVSTARILSCRRIRRAFPPSGRRSDRHHEASTG